VGRSLFGYLSSNSAYEAFTVRKSDPRAVRLNCLKQGHISFGLIVHCPNGNTPFCNETTTALRSCKVNSLILSLPPPLSQIDIGNDLTTDHAKSQLFDPVKLSKWQIYGDAFEEHDIYRKRERAASCRGHNLAESHRLIITRGIADYLTLPQSHLAFAKPVDAIKNLKELEIRRLWLWLSNRPAFNIGPLTVAFDLYGPDWKEQALYAHSSRFISRTCNISTRSNSDLQPKVGYICTASTLYEQQNQIVKGPLQMRVQQECN
jgi:hypothetical protein